MNKPAAIIAGLFGTVFLAVEMMYPGSPAYRWVSDLGLFSTDQSKARAAVTKLLLVPDSGEFAAMRSVTVDKNKYVCGTVRGKTRAGSYGGQRDFFYNVVSDYATVDDDGQITRPHGRYRPCPVLEAKKSSPLPIDLEKASKIINAFPTPSMGGSNTDPAASAASMANGLQGALPGGGSAGGSSAQQSASSASKSTFVASLDNEKNWRADELPKAWPKFPSDNPLSRLGTKVPPKEALAQASRIEDRWQTSDSSKSGTRPSVNEIEDALRTLLTVDETSEDYPRAWASFTRLRKIQAAAIALAATR